ncbi:tetratricopeptide repeat protein [Gimesia sp.]|uniref:tetratricopeptide repeat protein n=1 Tax=Gimesia sp. TaxID=2024833 RepID=UPI003A8C94F2
MPVFLISGNNENGKRETRRVEADNSQDAVRECEEQGLTEIVLHNDDAFAAATDLFGPQPDVDQNLTAADLVEMQYLTNFQLFLFYLRKSYWQLRWVIPVLILIAVYRWDQVSGPDETDYIMLGFLLLPIPICFWNAYYSLGRKYDRLIYEFSWGNWEEVLHQVARLRGKIPDFELSARAAVALAALDRFDEALAQMEPYEESDEVPRWMYLGRLSELYEVTKDYDTVIECMRQAYEIAPENPTVIIDYAYALTKTNRDSPLAAELIADAEELHLNDLVALLLKYFKGVLELNFRNYRAAEALFRQCEAELVPLAVNQALLQQIVDLNRGYLAVTLAELEEKEEAERLYQLSLPRLQALDCELIMDRYADAMRK